MTLAPISPLAAHRLQREGARLVDIRPADEYARSHPAGAENLPVDRLQRIEGDGPVIFLCRSGMRAGANAARLAGACPAGAYALEGGLDAWRAEGLPVEADRRAPLEIMRQVQIAAGLLVLTGVILGLALAPGWFALAGFVGAGLTFAGVSGWCGMARLLAVMPWNRRGAAG